MSGKERDEELKNLIFENRKQTLLDAAEKLFLAKGYDNCTMQDVADEAGYSKGTVYNYFKSKDELFLASGIKAYDLIIDFIKKFTEKESPGLKQLTSIGKSYYEFSKQHPNYATIFHDIGVKLPNIEDKKDLSEIEQTYLDKSHAYEAIFLDVLKNAMKVNAIRRDKDPRLIGFVLSRVSLGVISDLLESPNVSRYTGSTADEIVEFVFEILEEGLKPRTKK